MAETLTPQRKRKWPTEIWETLALVGAVVIATVFLVEAGFSIKSAVCTQAGLVVMFYLLLKTIIFKVRVRVRVTLPSGDDDPDEEEDEVETIQQEQVVEQERATFN